MLKWYLHYEADDVQTTIPISWSPADARTVSDLLREFVAKCNAKNATSLNETALILSRAATGGAAQHLEPDAVAARVLKNKCDIYVVSGQYKRLVFAPRAIGEGYVNAGTSEHATVAPQLLEASSSSSSSSEDALGRILEAAEAAIAAKDLPSLRGAVSAALAINATNVRCLRARAELGLLEGHFHAVLQDCATITRASSGERRLSLVDEAAVLTAEGRAHFELCNWDAASAAFARALALPALPADTRSALDLWQRRASAACEAVLARDTEPQQVCSPVSAGADRIR